MGFSVSGAMAVLLIGLFVAFAMVFPTAIASFEDLSEAQQIQSEQAISLHNAEVNLTAAVFDNHTNQLEVTLENHGTEALDIDAIDLLVDGTYTSVNTSTVANRSDTSLWLPEETLILTATVEEEPTRTKVVTEHGLASAAFVETEGEDG